MSLDLPISLFSEPDTVRLISAAYIDEPALAPLADSKEDLAILEALEGLTSQRRMPRLPIPGDVDPRELLTEAHGYGWTYVNAAFCYTRMGGSRFNGVGRGAWYATFGPNAVETAQAEVSWHLTRELAATGIFENTTLYRELRAGFSTRFHDLRPHPDHPALAPDPDEGYPRGQALARDVLAKGGNGVIYPSVRAPNGTCLAALRPSLVQNIRSGDLWAFTWSGTPTPAIVRQN